VPVTVLSRCLQFNLRPMAPETIREHLQKVLLSENVAVDLQSLRLLARAARGSMRDALSLTDQAIAFGAGQLQEATVRQMLGSVDRSYVFRLLEALALGDGKTVVETSEVLRLNGLSAASTLEEMSAVLQRMAVLQAVPGLEQAGDDVDPELADLVRLAGLMPADETQLLYSLCLHGRGELGLAPDEYAALTMVLLRLLAFKPGVAQTTSAEKKTLKAPAAEAPPRASSAPIPLVQATKPPPIVPSSTATIAPEPASAPVAQPAPPGKQLPVLDSTAGLSQVRAELEKAAHGSTQQSSIQTPSTLLAVPVRVQADSRSEAAAGASSAANLVPTEEGEFWHQTVQQLVTDEAITALVRELALQSQLVARDTDQWILRVERESLSQPGSRERLTAALQAAGHAVRLTVEVGRVTDSPARRNAALAAQRQLAAEKIIFDDPFVQSMMRDFGAKIVPGSIRPG
jgi:DNA polymerase-3 subunit gamma/tau